MNKIYFVIKSALFLGGIVVFKYENCSHAVCSYDLSARPLTASYTLAGDLPRELNPLVKHVSREV